MSRWKIILVALATTLTISLIWTAGYTQAHGTAIDYRTTTAIEITARFDNGEPMSQAQIIVYAPNDPATPWLKGQSDDQGRFIFAPDPTIPGNWTVSVRTGGHGEMLHISLGEDTATLNGQVNRSGPTTLQTLLMSVSGVWGFIGTALYFSRGKEN